MKDDDSIPTRQSLLERLRDWSDQESWRTFFDTYWRLIHRTALRSGLSEPEAQDVVQETVISVLKELPRYDRTKGSFKNWLMRLTGWRIADQYKKRQPGIVSPSENEDNCDGAGEVDRQRDPAALPLEVAWEEEWERNLLDAAVANLKQRVDPRHYQMFDLLFFKGWPVMRVARSLRVNRAEVYLVKHRLSSLVKKEIEQLRNELL